MGKSLNSRGGKEKWLEVGFPALVIAVFLVLLLFKPHWEVPTGGAGMGKPAPEIRFSEYGKESSLEAYRGKVVLLNFWAGWCGPCVEEMPSLSALESTFRGKDFVILAFNVDPSETLENSGTQGIDTPKHLIFDFDREQTAPYQTGAIPVSVLVDRQGVVREVFTGPRNWASSHFVAHVEGVLVK